ncbi:MAG: hypothetical protein HUU37_09775, partial [Bdellovibrionales bacterium]|nr:hypothetical protein [Bdellovibrionales bacterium]
MRGSALSCLRQTRIQEFREMKTILVLLTVWVVSAWADESAGEVSLSDTWAIGDLWGAEEEYGDPGDYLDGFEYRARGRDALQLHETRRVQIVVRRSMKERGYQFLTVSVDGGEVHSAPVSTAWERMAPGKTGVYRAFTPDGKFFPDGMQARRYSNRWQVWLTHVIRFQNGIWLHATTPD